MQARIIALGVIASSVLFVCAIACSSNTASTADPVLVAKNREKVCSWVKELGYETRFDRPVRKRDPDLSKLAKRVNAEFEDADSTTDLLTRTAILFGKTRQRGEMSAEFGPFLRHFGAPENFRTKSLRLIAV